MHTLLTADGVEARLDRCPTPTLSPPSGTVVDVRVYTDGRPVTITAAGYTIRYNDSVGDYPETPATITDGDGGPSPESFTVGDGGQVEIRYVVAVAFDPAGILSPSAPVSGEYEATRYD